MDQEPFERVAARGRRTLLSELALYLRESRKWWMIPILLVTFLLGVFALLTSSPIAPFIYTLF